MSACSVLLHTIGYNKIVDNDLGGKQRVWALNIKKNILSSLKRKCMKPEIHTQIDIFV